MIEDLFPRHTGKLSFLCRRAVEMYEFLTLLLCLFLLTIPSPVSVLGSPFLHWGTNSSSRKAWHHAGARAGVRYGTGLRSGSGQGNRINGASKESLLAEKERLERGIKDIDAQINALD